MLNVLSNNPQPNVHSCASFDPCASFCACVFTQGCMSHRQRRQRRVRHVVTAHPARVSLTPLHHPHDLKFCRSTVGAHITTQHDTSQTSVFTPDRRANSTHCCASSPLTLIGTTQVLLLPSRDVDLTVTRCVALISLVAQRHAATADVCLIPQQASVAQLVCSPHARRMVATHQHAPAATVGSWILGMEVSAKYHP